MKKIIWMFLALFLGGFAFVCWKEADSLKNQITAFAKESGIEYDRIQYRGLPFCPSVEMKNAKFEYGDTHFRGDITVGANLLTKNGSVQAEGNWVGEFCIKGRIQAKIANIFSVLEKKKGGKDKWEDWLEDLSVLSEQLVISRGGNIISEVGRAKLNLKYSKSDQPFVAFEISGNGVTSASVFVDPTLKNKTDFFLKGNLVYPSSTNDENFAPISAEITELKVKDLYAQFAVNGKISLEEVRPDDRGSFFLSASWQLLQPYPAFDRDKFFAYIEPFFQEDPASFAAFKMPLEKNWDMLAQLMGDWLDSGQFKSSFDWRISKSDQSRVSFEVSIDGVPSMPIFVDSAPKNRANGSFKGNVCFGSETGFPLSLEITEFKVEDLYTRNALNGKFGLEEEGTEYRSSVCLSINREVLQSYPPVDKQKFLIHLAQSLQDYPDVFFVFKDFLQNHWDALVQLVPNQSDFGQIKMNIDTELLGAWGNSLPPPQLNIRKFKCECELYGLDLSGKIKWDEYAPQMELAVRLNHHRDLFLDFIHFYNRAGPLLTQLFGPCPSLSDKVAAKLSMFLESLSHPTSEGSLNLTLKLDENGELKVGSKPIAQLETEFAMLIAEIFAELSLDSSPL